MEKETTIIAGSPAQAGFVAPRDDAANNSPIDSPAENEERAAKAEKAAFARAARKQEEAEEEKKRTEQAMKPGFQGQTSPVVPPQDLASEKPVRDFDLKGKGWIYCGKNARGQGTWIKDCGDSIDVPFSKKFGMSEGQKRKILELSHEKGWSTLYAFKSNGRQLHPLATQILQSSGIPCCADPKAAKTLDTWKSLCKEQHRHHCEASAQPQQRAEATSHPHLQQTA